jgi:hypothetical protein
MAGNNRNAEPQECTHNAAAARDPETKRTHEGLAQQWLDLLKQAETVAAGLSLGRRPTGADAFREPYAATRVVVSLWIYFQRVPSKLLGRY